jgi:hypothetical protein
MRRGCLSARRVRVEVAANPETLTLPSPRGRGLAYPSGLSRFARNGLRGDDGEHKCN